MQTSLLVLQYLAFAEEVRQMLHSIGPNTGDVVVAAGMLQSESLDSVVDIITDLDPDLHAQHQRLGE